MIGESFTFRCHVNEYDDLLTLFHFFIHETFFLKYAKFQQNDNVGSISYIYL